MMEQVLFYLFASVAVVSALLTITRRNAIYSALFLVLCFFALAALYVMLNAQFIAAVQVIVYAGAVMVLFLFVIMLLDTRKPEAGDGVSVQTSMGWICGLVLAMQAGFFLWGSKLANVPKAEQMTQESVKALGSTEVIAYFLFSKYLYPFEIISALLLIAIVGAVVIAGKKRPE